MKKWPRYIAALFPKKFMLQAENNLKNDRSPGDKVSTELNNAISLYHIELFDALCQFVWIQGEPLPLVFDLNEKVYTQQGITKDSLKQLERCGLISFDPVGFVKKKFGKHTRLFYCGQPIKIGFPDDMNNQLDLGHVILTERGKALVSDRSIPRNQAFYEYVIRRWHESGYLLASIQVDKKWSDKT